MRMKREIVLLFTGLAGIVWVHCASVGPTANGGSGTETTTGITATALYPNGTPATGAIVRLRRNDYLSRLPAPAKSAFYGADALTDSNGRFEITGIDPGSYRIEVTDGHAAALFACSLDVRDTVNLGVDTLRPFATLIGAADTTGAANPQLFAQVAGLERLAAVGIDGQYALTDLPQGIFSLHVGSNATGAATTIIAGVQAVSADTAVVRSPLPAPWTGASIGNETPVGGAMYINGRFTIAGGGSDIWNRADGFHFVYQPWSGDGEIVAHVTYFEYGHYSCKAGLMFRESLDTASVNIGASMEIDSAGTYKVCSHSRKSMGALSDGKYSARGYRTPQWLRLRRSGEIFTTAVSPDGATWTAVYVDTVAMASSGYVGLAVTSHDTTRLSTAVFEHVTAR